jgi:cellulose synthase/poly-beta-1,6-N-acetylglucosamine synthase-like glycosyltransferase
LISNLLLLVMVCAALPAILSSVYLLVQTLLSGAAPRPETPMRRTGFDIVVPAHNEAGNIAKTVASLRAIDWPSELFRIVVVADNCTDNTAAMARAAGATVIERHDPQRRGKGYALEYAFQFCKSATPRNAVVVVDADAIASANLLEAFAARILAGEDAIQAHYGVLNPLESWRTRLITIAKASFHIVRSRARERLGLSCGIRGNGWCVTQALLEKVPYRAFSLTEDLEYGIQLGLAGYRVAYADEAHSDAEMVSDEKIATKQRQRWEAGRFQLIRSMTAPLLRAAFAKRSAICFDLAMDLLVLPLSYIVVSILGLAVLAAIAAARIEAAISMLWVALGCAVCLVLYVLRGWQLSGLGARGLLDLVRAPGFIAWKLLISLRKRSTEWVRTERERRP